MTAAVWLLSGGAAQGLVRGLEQHFGEANDHRIEGTFGAVGAMKEKLLAGARCDVMILTQTLIDGLIESGHLVAGSARPIGVVKTGVAVRDGEADPEIATPATLASALLAAQGIYVPDTDKSTAGIHVMKVLAKLGIASQVEKHLRVFPNGEQAMRALADTSGPNLIGVTQVTEILYTSGVRLVAPLPAELELATVYSAAVATRAQSPEAARKFIDLLAGAAASRQRQASGFD